MELPLLTDLFKLFAVSIVVLLVNSRLRIPAIVGFLVTGVLAGPHGLGLVQHAEEVEVLAEVGVILLLFAIGIEFSFEQLGRIRKAVFVGGTLQLLFTFGAALAVSRFAGLTYAQGVFNAFLFSLSSTAIVLKLLQQRGQMDSPHGKVSLGILIYQDIAVVPMMLLVPYLAQSSDAASSLGGVLTGFGVAALVVVAARWVVPRLLHTIARTRDREFFLLTVVAICLGVAWATNQVGLSLSLGAFLAGLIISESEYSQEAMGNILPLKDLFTTLFFVSIGMLLDVRTIVEQPLLVLSLTVLVLGIKAFIAALAAFFLGYPLRTTLLVGIALSQVGEFSFVIAQTGLDHGLMNARDYQLYLAVSVLTMAATPFVIMAAPRIAALISRLPLPPVVVTGFGAPPDETTASKKTGHLVIVGYGVNGRNLAGAAKKLGIAYDVLEMNADVVRAERHAGEPIWFGDATQESVLEHVNVAQARVVVIAVSDPAATRRITRLVRKQNGKGFIIVRTRYVQELRALYELGASRVVPEEFETSVQIFSLALRAFGQSRQKVDEIANEVRDNGYALFRTLIRHEDETFDRTRMEDLPDDER